jgi:hypothetical protein
VARIHIDRWNRGQAATQRHGHLCPKAVKRTQRSPHMQSAGPHMSPPTPSRASETSPATPSRATRGASGQPLGSRRPIKYPSGSTSRWTALIKEIRRTDHRREPLSVGVGLVAAADRKIAAPDHHRQGAGVGSAAAAGGRAKCPERRPTTSRSYRRGLGPRPRRKVLVPKVNRARRRGRCPIGRAAQRPNVVGRVHSDLVVLRTPPARALRTDVSAHQETRISRRGGRKPDGWVIVG